MTVEAVVVRADHEIAAERSGSRVWLALRGNPTFWIGTLMVIAIVLLAVLAPVLAPHDPDQQFRREGLDAHGDPVGPSAAFPLGTDLLARDELSRLLFGARTSLTVGIVANVLATVIGVTVGAVAAFARNLRIPLSRRADGPSLNVPIEAILMRVTDAILSFPVLLLAIALVSIIGASLTLVVAVIAGVLWTGVARIVYSRMVVLREAEFVAAARAVGVSSPRIVTRHVLPHLTSIIAVYATLGIASTVLFEATLSFLGVGVPLPAATWGQMISQHLGYYDTDPRLVVLPGLAIMVTILAFNLLGDALADAFDPHSWR
ncbi:MAG TPA: ABC transporter permease [Candidatus Limnocylindrales bacterium]|nr:ABC transporter permease [Candidatus Limnocylindrales bacterium]